MFKKLINYLLREQVPPIEGYFPSIEGMNKNQQRFYRTLKKNLDLDKALELENNIGYIFLYLYEILDSKEPKKTIYNLKKVQNLYKQYKQIDIYCQLWISDCYVLLNEIQNAIYISSRHLSKITKIDYDSLTVVWTMGLFLIIKRPFGSISLDIVAESASYSLSS